MSQVQNRPEPRTVFVSYAHESPAFRVQVKQLCDWLRGQGVAVVCDFDHAVKPPSKGWAIWMQHAVEDAGVVLVIASPKYKARFEKRAEPDSGKGVAWEGAIITQDLYDAAQRNDKFFPILPDGGSHDDVPKALKPWDNGHRFPSGQAGVLELIRECVAPRIVLAPPIQNSNVPSSTPAVNVSVKPANRGVNLVFSEKAGTEPTAGRVDLVFSERVQEPEELAFEGEAKFDYSNHDGRFEFGQGVMRFESRWSKGSDTAIHCYKDNTNLISVALPPKGQSPESFVNIGSFDGTSRVRTVQKGEFVVLQNDQHSFALVQVLGIQDRSRSDSEDQLHIRYWTQAPGQVDFSSINVSAFDHLGHSTAAQQNLPVLPVAAELVKSPSASLPELDATQIKVRLASQFESQEKLPMADAVAACQVSLGSVENTDFYRRLATGVKVVLSLQTPPTPSELLRGLTATTDADQLVEVIDQLQSAVGGMTDAGDAAVQCCDAAVSFFCVWVHCLGASPQASNFQSIPCMQRNPGEPERIANMAGLRLGGFFTAAAFGRKLEFEESNLGLSPKHGRRLFVGENGDFDEEQAHWELHNAFSLNSEGKQAQLARGGVFNQQAQATLKTRIRAKRDQRVDNNAVFAVVSGNHIDGKVAMAVAGIYQDVGLVVVHEDKDVREEPFQRISAISLYAHIETLFAQIVQIKTQTHPGTSNSKPTEQPMNTPSTTTQTNHIYGPAQINTASGDHSTVHAVWNLDQSQKIQLQTLGANLIQVAAQNPQLSESKLLTDLGNQLQTQAQLPEPDKSVVAKISAKLEALAELVNAGTAMHDAVVAGIAVLGPILTPIIGGA